MLSRSKLGLGRTEPRKSALRGPAVVKSKEAVHDTCSTASFRLQMYSIVWRGAFARRPTERISIA